MNYKKITKTQVKALIRKNGSVEVGLLPSKANPNSIWISPTFLNISDVETLEKYVNEYSYYNCNKDLGNQVSFWIKEVTN